METSFQEIADQRQWNELVDNLWTQALPHLRDQGLAFVDPALLLNMSADRYGFEGEDWDEDTDNELGGDLNKEEGLGEESGGESLPPQSMDYDDPLLYQEQSFYPSIASTIGRSTRTFMSSDMSVRETLKQGLEDPSIRQEMLRMINKKKGAYCNV